MLHTFYYVFLLLHVFLHVCNLVEKNRCPSLHMLMDTRQPLVLAKTAEASMHTCVECQMEQPSFTLLVILNAATLYPIVSVQYILYTVLGLYYLIMLYSIKGMAVSCSYISYIYNSFIYYRFNKYCCIILL